MPSRSSCSLPTCSAALAVSMLVAAALPCRAQAPATAPSGGAAVTLAPAPPRPALRLRTLAPQMSLEAQWKSESLHLGSGQPAQAGDGAVPVMATRTDRMKRAFAAEMREEAIRSRRAGLYATIPAELPELLEDDYIRKEQSRLAESVIGSAFEAAVAEGFLGGRRHSTKVTIRPYVAVAKHGISLDASPSWTYRVDGARSGFRLEVPMTSSALKMHAYRILNGTDRTPMRLGAGLVVDPVEEEIRAGISLQF